MAEVKKENWFVRTWHKVCKFFRELRSELKRSYGLQSSRS